MATEIELRNLSGQQVDEGALREATRKVLAAEGAQLMTLGLALVDDERITSLNRRLLQRDGPTDVIAFEADEGEGEIIISMDTAARQAGEVGHTVVEELRFLVAHGVLHVLGWDDGDPVSRQRMIERQHEILGTIQR